MKRIIIYLPEQSTDLISEGSRLLNRRLGEAGYDEAQGRDHGTLLKEGC